MNSFYYYFILITLIISESSAQTLLQTAKNKNGEKLYLILGVLFYSLVGFVYYFFLKLSNNLGLANIIWNTSTSIIISLISILYFKQKLKLKQILGAIIIVLGGLLI